MKDAQQSEQFYEVEKILDRKKVKGKFQYLIKWKGYPLSESTWEPLSHLQYMKDSVNQFNALLDKAKNETISSTNKENENSDNGNSRGRKKKFFPKKNQLIDDEFGIDNKQLGLKEEEEEKKENKSDEVKDREKSKIEDKEKEKEKNKKPETIMNEQRYNLRSSVAKKEENILENELINKIDRPTKNRNKRNNRSRSRFLRSKISKSKGRIKPKEVKTVEEEKKEEKEEKENTEDKKEDTYTEKKEEKKEEEKIDEKEENPNRKMFFIDEEYTQILGIKMENQKLIAVVERKDNNDRKQVLLSTKELKTKNPWILIDYYENRINFE
jgi:hypothetical protein